jgi:hypothetical protein
MLVFAMRDNPATGKAYGGWLLCAGAAHALGLIGAARPNRIDATCANEK